MAAARQMILGALLSYTGLHLAGWRHPDVNPWRASSLEHCIELARLAEQGRLDFLFMADSLATMYSSQSDAFARIAPLNDFEPLTLLSALAVVTRDIGLIGSMTTTYNEPFHIARQFASLDRISGGRAGWNVVTSFNPAEAFNFGQTAHAPLPERYARALESVDVVRRLWSSWAADALLRDQASGVYFDAAKVRAIDHKGEFFSVRGPLTMPRPPQGHPVIVQSGSSELGRDAGARVAEFIFTAQQDLGQAQAFYQDMKRRVAEVGRDPAQVRVVPGIVPILAATEDEAREDFSRLQRGIHPDVGLSLLSSLLGDIDLRACDLDGPLPEIESSDAQQGRVAMFIETARRDNLSIRQLYERVAGGARGHWTVVGSVKQVADVMEQWFNEGAADGFSLIPAYLPTSLRTAVELLVPELQRRGLFKHEYAAGTLREKMGLPVPE